MASETNPFRMSMMQRSQSPEDPFEGGFEVPPLRAPYLTHQQQQPQQPQQPQYSGNSGTNPFRVDLPAGTNQQTASVPPPASRGGPAQTLEPPSYYESEGRRHSDPQLTRPDDEKTRLAVRDDSYREGYEEGMRIARERERQRRREYRERRMRSGGSSSAAGERSAAERVSGERGSGSNRVSSGDRERRDQREHSSRDRNEQQQQRRSGGDRSSGDRSGHRDANRVRSKSESAGGSSSRHHRSRKANNESLDVIDKLDATGLYGGSGFHHDGPFDACTPHRNSGKSKRSGPAPIAAFPADGPNNSLAVENPALVAYRKDEAVFGRDVLNFDIPPEASQNSFDPTDRGAKVHGERTFGLGSTTFVDGTPASRDAIAQQQQHQSSSAAYGGNLGRSRSLLRRQPSAPRRNTIDEDIEDEVPKSSLLSRVRSLRVGRH